MKGDTYMSVQATQEIVEGKKLIEKAKEQKTIIQFH